MSSPAPSPDASVAALRGPSPGLIAAALAAGSLMTFMLLCNSTLAAHSTPAFSSLTAHGTGTVVAIVLVIIERVLRRRAGPAVAARGRAPLWAYMAGISGALTVVLTSVSANSALALTGTLALGIAGQVLLALLFDLIGALGLKPRRPRLQELLALGMIVAGTGLVIASRGDRLMALMILIAFAGGMLVSLSRQLNGRLALQTSALEASLWNHFVGFAVLFVVSLAIGGLWPDGVAGAPWFAWAGGAIGVVFVAAGSWLIPRLGAAMTGGLLVAGQMLMSVALDFIRGVEAVFWMQALGVALILGGIVLAGRR